MQSPGSTRCPDPTVPEGEDLLVEEASSLRLDEVLEPLEEPAEVCRIAAPVKAVRDEVIVL